MPVSSSTLVLMCPQKMPSVVLQVTYEDPQALQGDSHGMLTSSSGCVTPCIYAVRKALIQARFIVPSYRHFIKAPKWHR